MDAWNEYLAQQRRDEEARRVHEQTEASARWDARSPLHRAFIWGIFVLLVGSVVSIIGFVGYAWVNDEFAPTPCPAGTEAIYEDDSYGPRQGQRLIACD